MRKNVKTIIPLSLILILTVYANSFAQNNFLWRIQSKTGTVYALGSIHLLKPDTYPLSSTIEDAFNKSDSLAVEANVNNIDMANLEKMMANAFYPEGDSLDRHISKNAMEIIKKEMDKIGLPPEVFYKQKPWLLALMLESLKLMAAGYNPEYGIDKYFLSQAADKKKIIELESVDYQINLLSGFSDREQELFLLYTLKDLQTLVADTDNIVRSWKSGDAKLMESIIKEGSFGDEQFYPIYDKLIIQRNKSITSKIEGFLKTKGTYFVVVGAAHLLGKKGIVQLLKEKGYAIEQM
jgi:uncharacterized protein